MEKGRVVLEITGMTCGHCVAAVKRALGEVPGVGKVEVTLSPPRATVSCDSSTTVEKLTKAIAEEGYSSSPLAG